MDLAVATGLVLVLENPDRFAISSSPIASVRVANPEATATPDPVEEKVYVLLRIV